MKNKFSFQFFCGFFQVFPVVRQFAAENYEKMLKYKEETEMGERV